LEENITIEGIIYELILYNNSGFVPFTKEEWGNFEVKKFDLKIGKMFRIEDTYLKK